MQVNVSLVRAKGDVNEGSRGQGSWQEESCGKCRMGTCAAQCPGKGLAMYREGQLVTLKVGKQDIECGCGHSGALGVLSYIRSLPLW